MHTSFKTVSVVGLGYIGLPTAATIASRGIQVLGVDISSKAVDAINQARAHFSEPDLDGLVQSAVMSGRLKAFTEPQPADAFIVAVPTPIQRDRSPDMSYVERATRALAKVLKEGDLVILESTSPVGTTEWMAGLIRDERSDLVEEGGVHNLKISMAYCPERILPGRMVLELIENDRIVGGVTRECTSRAKSLYATFVRGNILETNAAVAELCKLIENAYRDVNIAFANEVANICEKMNLDAWEAIRLANHHPRVNILNPGPGVGGHCIAVDPWFLIHQHPSITPLIRAARDVNDERPDTVVAKVGDVATRIGSRKVACLGLAYKPDVDDLRESPAVEIVGRLAAGGYHVLVCEPHVDEMPDALKSSTAKLLDLEDAVASSDIVVLLVGHKVFMDFDRAILEGKSVIDSVGLWRDSKF